MRNALTLWNDRFLNDGFFSDFFLPEEKSVFTPPVDVEETGDQYRLSFDLPGLNKSDIKIDVADGRLVVSGSRAEERTDKKFNRTERFYGKFERSFSLPKNVDLSSVDANYKDGVLSVSLPKTEPAQLQKIEVK